MDGKSVKSSAFYKLHNFLSVMKELIQGYLHIFLVVWLFERVYHKAPVLYIPELHLTLYYTLVLYFLTLIYLVWLSCFQEFRERNCQGWVMRVLFDLIPAEIFLLLVFAQWHFRIAVFCFLLWLAVVAGFSLFLSRWEHGMRRRTRSRGRMSRKYHYSIGRIAVFAMAVIFAVPCFFALFVYDMQPAVYTADESVAQTLVDAVDETGAEAEAEEEKNIYQENLALLSCFGAEKWADYSITEKISLLKELADMEAEILGIPAVPVSSSLLDSSVLGLYDTETNEIYIDVTYLEGMAYLDTATNAEQCVTTTCHEMFHAYQQYCIDQMDWDSDLAQTHYFDELRSWYENSNDYKTTEADGYEAYADQVLEESARAYADEESERIFAYIE